MNSKEFVTNLSTQLRRLRKLNNYTQSDVAGVVGKHVTTVSSWENILVSPYRLPSFKDLLTLCDFFDIEIGTLLHGDTSDDISGVDTRDLVEIPCYVSCDDFMLKAKDGVHIISKNLVRDGSDFCLDKLFSLNVLNNDLAPDINRRDILFACEASLPDSLFERLDNLWIVSNESNILVPARYNSDGLVSGFNIDNSGLRSELVVYGKVIRRICQYL